VGANSLALRSPGLSPLDLFFWAFVKTLYFCEKEQNINMLRDRIFRAAECVSNEMLASTWLETEYHLHICRATNDGHVELC
jgi:hypothetical protein